MEENMFRYMRKPAAWCLALSLLVAAPAAAQFNNGSSGIHGSFPPGPIPAATTFMLWNMATGLIRYCSEYDLALRRDSCTTEVGTAQIPNIPEGGLTTGRFEFDHVNLFNPSFNYLYVLIIPNAYNAPLSILSANEIHFTSVQFYADGLPGASTGNGLQPGVSLPGGRPGPGGFAGGASGFPGSQPTDGNPGFGPGGGVAGVAGSQCVDTFGQNALASPTSTTLAQLIGGSGGGGGSSASVALCGLGKNNGASGGGGGGAVLLSANSEIRFDGAGAYLYLNGGNGGSSFSCGCYDGGGGSGGALKLVAPRMLGAGYITLNGGYGPRIGYAAGGAIRVEGDATQLSTNISGESSGSVVATPGAITPTVTPALRITQIGDQPVPAAPTGNTATPDVSFATPPTGPVTVSLSAANIPLTATVKVRVTPQVGSFTEVMSDPLAGSVSSSTATASVTIPPGYGSIVATASFGCDSTFCALLPAKDRPGAVVEVVASAGTSRAFIVTKDGQRIALGN
jgi:hypothetical protein